MAENVNEFGDIAVAPSDALIQPTMDGANQFGDMPIRKNINDPLEFLNTIAQGATLGWGDEISAGIAGAMAKLAGYDFKDAYDYTLADIRGNMDQFKKEHPKLAATGEIGGAVVTGAMTGGRVLGGAMNPAVPAMVRYPAIAALGAGEGAVYGAGASEDGRVLPALQGALMGAVLAPVGTKVTDWLVKGGKTGASFLGRKLTDTPREQALRAVRNAAISEGIDAEDAIRTFDELGPDATIADLGEEFRRLARAASDQPGEFRGQARQLLNNRQMGQQSRLMTAAEVATGQRAGNFNAARQSLVDARKDTAQPLYQAAFDMGIETTDNLQSIISRPAMKRAMNGAESLARDMGEWTGEMNLMKQVHYAKLNLDRQISRAVRSEGRSSPQVRALMKTKTDLMGEITSQNKSYKSAVDAFSSDSAMIDAMDEGINLFKLKPDQMDEMLQGMSKSEKDMFQLGAVRAIKDVFDETNMTHDATKRLLGKPINQQRLARVMDDPDSFIQRAMAESEFTQTNRVVTGGSQTSTNLAGQDSLTDSIQTQLIPTLITQDATAAGAALVRTLSKQKVTPELITELADIMLTQGVSPTKMLEIFMQPSVSQGLGSSYREVVLPVIAGALSPITSSVSNAMSEQ